MTSWKREAKKSWLAMIKFADDKPLTSSEWKALSWITLIDRDYLVFDPSNCRWAKSDEERADNLVFYRSLGSKVS